MGALTSLLQADSATANAIDPSTLTSPWVITAPTAKVPATTAMLAAPGSSLLIDFEDASTRHVPLPPEPELNMFPSTSLMPVEPEPTPMTAPSGT